MRGDDDNGSNLGLPTYCREVKIDQVQNKDPCTNNFSYLFMEIAFQEAS